MQSDININEVNFNNYKYKFFHSNRMTLNDLIKYINLDKYDLSKLDDIVDELRMTLDKYKDVIDLSEKRCNNTIEGFKHRIDLLIKFKINKY